MRLEATRSSAAEAGSAAHILLHLAALPRLVWWSGDALLAISLLFVWLGVFHLNSEREPRLPRERPVGIQADVFEVAVEGSGRGGDVEKLRRDCTRQSGGHARMGQRRARDVCRWSREKTSLRCEHTVLNVAHAPGWHLQLGSEHTEHEDQKWIGHVRLGRLRVREAQNAGDTNHPPAAHSCTSWMSDSQRD